MSLSLYVGPPQSGKTYEVVRSVVLSALRIGRPVITNIPGLDPIALEALVGRPVDIRILTDEQFCNELIYPTMKEPVSEVLPGGSVVVVDEAYNIFPPGKETTARMITFIRTHRHFTADYGDGHVAMDVVLITQDVMSIHPRVRSVSENVIFIRSMSMIPMFKGRYRYSMYASANRRADTFRFTSIRKYDRNIFKLYHSFTGGVVAEVAKTDSSGGLLKPWHGPAALIAVAGIGYGAYNLFHFDSFGIRALPACNRSTVLVDLQHAKYFKAGVWADARIAKVGGAQFWDVGGCRVSFGKE